MSYKYKTIFSLLVYILSIGLLTLADFIVVSSFSQENIAEWAFYKSLIFIFGGMCVLGFDQLLLREIEQYLNFKKQFLIQSLFISFLVSLGLYFYLESYIKSLLCFFIMFFYSFSLFEAGYWRGKKELLISQLNTNLWKICIFIVLSIFTFFNLSKNILQHYFLAFFISFLILILINNFCRGKNDIIKNNNKGDKIKYFFLGVYFFLHSFSLVIANYGEQFLINIFHNKELSKLIFSYITIYSSLVLAGKTISIIINNFKAFNFRG